MALTGVPSENCQRSPDPGCHLGGTCGPSGPAVCWRVLVVPHHPKPFFRSDRRLWYVQLDGRQVNLGPDREAAFDRYHELMTPRGRKA
jgi:hypothetical protein